jgi:hypothetical protein
MNIRGRIDPVDYSALRASPLRGRRVRGVQLGQTAELSARSASTINTWHNLQMKTVGEFKIHYRQRTAIAFRVRKQPPAGRVH